MRRIRRRSQRVALAVVALTTLFVLVPGQGSALATSCGVPLEVLTVRGTLVSNEPAEFFGGDTHHVIELETADEPARFLVFGKPERLVVGQSYEAEVHRFDDVASVRSDYAWLHGDNPCGPNTSIVAVNDDGSTSTIARYPGLGLPFSRTEFLSGFAIFAAGVFVMSRLTRAG